MAAVLDALVPYVKKLIIDTAKEEGSMLLGVSSQITKLDGTMENLKNFVSDAETRRITDQDVQRWVNKMKDAMYDATDIMELCQLEADERREEKQLQGGNREQNLLACFQPLLVLLQNQNPVVSLITCGGIEKMQGFFHRFLFCLENPVFAHEMGNRIKELNQRLEGIYKEADKHFKFKSSIGFSNPEPAELSNQKTISLVDESAIVGEQIERDTKELVQVLTTDDKNHGLKVLSIVGTGGMGKTTLAQKIFNDATIQEHFRTKIWLSITHEQCDEAELLRTAIKHAGGKPGEEQDKSTLTNTLIGTLSTKGRFLLVMDDVWSLEAWNNVLEVPVKNATTKQPGSRLVITTRSADLPKKMQAFLHEHRVRPLNNDDAWSLLKRQLQPDKVPGIDRLKTVGMEILESCGGLPIAIKVIGGLLSTKYPSEREWKSILNKLLAWSLTELSEEVDKRLYLSYEDLSPQLKQCFLYCSLFPKGVTMRHDVVTEMWISEGFIQPEIGTSSISDEYGLEEMAIDYQQELMKRNLIEPAEGSAESGYRFTMHDVVRTFARYLARAEALVMDGREQAATGGEMHFRRLSIEETVSVVEWGSLQRRESLRTLFVRNSKLTGGDWLGGFSSLRVLYICYAHSYALSTCLSELKHLRYLYLEKTNISSLPDDIHKMKFLQYITVYSCEDLWSLPENFIKLVHLRSLKMGGATNTVVPKGFGRLTNLRSLHSFPVYVNMVDESSSWCSLQELGPLSQLRTLLLRGLRQVSDSQMAEKAMISSKCHLRHLELDYIYCSLGSGEAMVPPQQSVIEDVLQKLCPPTNLEVLIIKGGYTGRHLPDWLYAPASANFESLRALRLENLPCCTQLPDGLWCLPCLEFLGIKDAPAIECIGHQFQGSSTMVAGTSAASTSAPFPKLTKLILIGLPRCKEWEWNHCVEDNDVEDAIAMPFLEILKIESCNLSSLPPGLTSNKRHALRELYLYRFRNLTHVENFPSVVKLDVFFCPKLKRISGLTMLQKIRIVCCPNVEVLEGVPGLDSLVWGDNTMDTLPGYLGDVQPRYLELDCNKKLYESCSSPGSSELEKINHIKSRNIVCIEN